MKRSLSQLILLIALSTNLLLTSCNPVKKVKYTEEYLERHQGNFVVDLPEIYELINILIAISDVGQKDSNMIDMTTDYHSEVIEYFSPFKEHEVMKRINKKIKCPESSRSYLNYLMYRWNALAYEIDERGKIVRNPNISPLNIVVFRDPIEREKKRVERFIEESNFRLFYNNHKEYYDSLTNYYQQSVPIEKMTNWLTSKFPGIEYDNYRVIISPLVQGTHYTRRFTDGEFTQAIMSVCVASENSRYNEAINEMLNSRVVFTEIDHNFVNPVSELYSKEIKSLLSNSEKWIKESISTDMYSNPEALFNEYLTWALFSLYAIDHFDKEDVEIYLPLLEEQMVEGRDFILFKEFNQLLIELYTKHSKLSLPELYPILLDSIAEGFN